MGKPDYREKSHLQGPEMMKQIFSIILVIVAMSSAALADEWVAKKLRGGVFVFQSGEWVQIQRGHVVSDDSAIQTAKGARVLFARGKETIDIRGDTRIRISDKEGAKRTVVSQDFGTITVDVEKRNVQHFEVRASLLAAVVKGTKFTVTSNNGAASIDVERGRVEARDEKAGMKVDVKPRQKVNLNMSDKSVLSVEGQGAKEPIRSTVTDKILSVKEIVKKVEKARPNAPIKLAALENVADQQGVALTKADRNDAIEQELKAAQKSGDVKSQDAAKAGAEAEQAKAEKKAADQALKDAKKSGDEASIAAAEKDAKDAAANDKAAKDAAKDADKAAKDSEKAADKAAKDAGKDEDTGGAVNEVLDSVASVLGGDKKDKKDKKDK